MKRFGISVVLSIATIFVFACEKSKSVPTSSGGSARATLVKNVPFRTAHAVPGVASELCAQLVVPATGSYAGIRMIEISAGPCPSGLVDDSQKNVFMFYFEPVGESNGYEIRDLEYNQRVGLAEWSSYADKANRNVTIINSLCTNGADLCYLDSTGGDLHIEVY